jgi:hypothetical protein
MNVAQLLRNQWDRAGACLATVIGLVALLLGYFGISGTSYTQEQLPYLISGGAFGLFMLGIAGVLWLTADLRDEWRKLDDLDGHLQSLLELEVTKAGIRDEYVTAEQAPGLAGRPVQRGNGPRVRPAAVRDLT